MKLRLIECKRLESQYDTSHVEDELVNDNLDETELEKASADFYARRKRIWIEFQKGDWLVAVAVYLILASVAFVVL